MHKGRERTKAKSLKQRETFTFQRKEANLAVLLKFIQPVSSGIRIRT